MRFLKATFSAGFSGFCLAGWLTVATDELYGSATPTLPSWAAEVGAQVHPSGQAIFSANSNGAIGDGSTLCTEAIQKTVDACARAGGGIVAFSPGKYLTGAIFLRSHVNFCIGKAVTLLGSQNLADYPARPTRVAGIEMVWPSGLLNVENQSDVEISGGGLVDGQGEIWWEKFRAMRKQYETRGLRWAADYDCARPRLIVVWKASDVTIENLQLRRSGFWTVQLVYSERCTARSLTVRDNAGPSTDGVDIDSSRNVLVEKCDIDNNDDCICLKAGRDYDGLRVNKPTEYIIVRDCVTRHGGGMLAFGSETSGGIRHVLAYNLEGIGTNEGIRFKSSLHRGGTVEDIQIENVRLDRVPRPFTFSFDWNPGYSRTLIPSDINPVPEHWKVLTQPVEPPARGLPEFRNITLINLIATGAKQILFARGLPEKPIGSIHWEHVDASGSHAGEISYARNWTMKDVRFSTPGEESVTISSSENVDSPKTGANIP